MDEYSLDFFKKKFESIEGTSNIYNYKLYKKVNEDLIFVKNMSRDEFEVFRDEEKITFKHSGPVHYRDSDAGYAVTETYLKDDFIIDSYNYFNMFFDWWCDENKIYNKEVFKDFLDDYILPNSMHFNYKRGYTWSDVKSIMKEVPEFVIKLFQQKIDIN